ncbi:MAG: hypothetical protein M3276_04720 [Actinomycetota bacterium]|nr:hypothetical protein [Actinomycetota bacterium]
MAGDDRGGLVAALLDRYGRQTLAEQAEIKLQDAPNTLFQVFQLAVLLDARVSPDTAVEAFMQLRERRWTTTKHLLDASNEDVTEALTGLGYPDSDAERIVVALSDAALHLEEDHGGDLGGLRHAVGRDPAQERERLMRFARVRDVAVDAFFREVQLLWGELLPFADKKVLDAAGRLGLGDDAAALRELTGSDEDFVRLEDALVRVRHDEDGYRLVRQAAGER